MLRQRDLAGAATWEEEEGGAAGKRRSGDGEKWRGTLQGRGGAALVRNRGRHWRWAALEMSGAGKGGEGGTRLKKRRAALGKRGEERATLERGKRRVVLTIGEKRNPKHVL